MDTHSVLSPFKEQQVRERESQTSGVRTEPEKGQGQGMQRNSGHCWRSLEIEEKGWRQQMLVANTTCAGLHCDTTRGTGHLPMWRMGAEVSKKDWPAAPSAGLNPLSSGPTLGS